MTQTSMNIGGKLTNLLLIF